MMSRVQFNLLPDSKLEFNRAQRLKRLVRLGSLIAVTTSLAIFLLMLFFVDVVQKKQMNDAGNQVDNASSQLNKLSVGNIITVQNQLQALATLHQNKHITSRIFTYLPKITPTNVTIDKLAMDMTQNTMSIDGMASSQTDVNSFVDTLKFATFKVNSQDNPALAFSSVVESGFGLNTGNVSFTIDMQFDPKLFANNLTNSQGNPVTPQVSVNQPPSTTSTLNPSSTLFNSTQTSAGGR